MAKPTDTGMNRTGIATSPIDSKRSMAAAQAVTTIGPIDGNYFENERVRWARAADPIGTVPPPGMVEQLRGHNATVLIDKLGERLAYERTGTRLYDALLAKFEAASVHVGGPTRADLEKHRSEEHDHFLLVRDAIAQLGADPTAMTPSADIVLVAGLGWIQVLTDPRTTLTQCLDVMLIAEQGDVVGWELLVDMAANLDLEELAEQFRMANATEDEHAARVKMWVSSALLGQVGVLPTERRDPNSP